jgi:hypothetical protein
VRRVVPVRVRRLSSRTARWLVSTTSPSRDYRYVFVVTYGRSGSTLLQGLLNAIPGYRIRGENGNALYRLYQADAAIASAHGKFTESYHERPHNAWYGAPSMRPDAFRLQLIEGFVDHVLRPQPGDRVLGFKEIRYTHGDMRYFAQFLDFLDACFPGCKIVFNHRDPAATARSSWWATMPKAEEKIRRTSERFLTVAADDRHFHFWYDQIDDSLTNIHELLAFLGEELDDEAIREVLGRAHGPEATLPEQQRAPAD